MTGRMCWSRICAATATLDGILGDLAALIRTLGTQKVEALGQGLGAQVAQELAHRHPGIVLNLERSAAERRHPVERYRVPVLLIRGQHQNPGLHTVHGCIAARSPGGQGVVIDDAGYLCHLERSEQINAAIRAFRAA